MFVLSSISTVVSSYASLNRPTSTFAQNLTKQNHCVAVNNERFCSFVFPIDTFIWQIKIRTHKITNIDKTAAANLKIYIYIITMISRFFKQSLVQTDERESK